MQYSNPHVGNIKRRITDIALWKLGYYGHGKHLGAVPENFSYPREKYRKKNGDEVTWIGHCTFLIATCGVHILTDPVFGKRVSPVPFIGPKRRHPPGVFFNNLPQIDVVLISHNHYDHLEKSTVKALHAKNPKTLWVVPDGVGHLIKKWGPSKVIELSWWDRCGIGFNHDRPLSLEITATPAQHFSGRKPFDFNRSLWAGYVVNCIKPHGKKQLYFSGDTGYNKHDFKDIGTTFGPMDLSLLPIGTYEPVSFMEPVHVGPSQAVRIHRDVQSKLSIGMHWKTFCLSDEPLGRPPYDLYRAMKRAKLDPKTFVPLDPGECINW